MTPSDNEASASTPPSAIGRLLDEISWEGNARKYRGGGLGRENVLTVEVFSALGTVGLSLGLTPTLPAAGKVMVILLMFLGRLGPLAVAYGLVRSRRGVSVRYPETDIMVG